MPSEYGIRYKDKRNWSGYNERLVRRGELYLSMDWLDSWDDELGAMNGGKRGRPYDFPESMMRFLAAVRQILRMQYRQMEGFLRGMSRVVAKVRPPDYTTLWWRIACMELEIPVPRGDGPVVVAIDSTGVKVTNRGEWMREKWHRHRGWIKVHLAVDVNGGPIAVEVTDERTGDSPMFPALVEKAERALGNGRIQEVLADAAYDSRANFQLLEDKGIGSGIRIKAGATCKSYGSSARPRAVRELRSLGYEGWRERHGYGMRWAAEWTFSALKRMLGESLMAKKTDLMYREAMSKFAVYAMLLQMP
jgi:hypothetical protein